MSKNDGSKYVSNRYVIKTSKSEWYIESGEGYTQFCGFNKLFKPCGFKNYEVN